MMVSRLSPICAVVSSCREIGIFSNACKRAASKTNLGNEPRPSVVVATALNENIGFQYQVQGKIYHTYTS